MTAKRTRVITASPIMNQTLRICLGWLMNSKSVPLLTCPFALLVLPFPNEKHRQLYHKELSPLSLPRSTTCILIFSVQREYIFQTKHHSLCTIIYIYFSPFSIAIFFHCFLLFSSLAFGF
jgi:hypothetical protein